MEIVRNRDVVKIRREMLNELIERHVKLILGREAHSVKFHTQAGRDTETAIGIGIVELKFPDEEGKDEPLTSDVAVVLTKEEREALRISAKAIEGWGREYTKHEEAIAALLKRSKVQL